VRHTVCVHCDGEPHCTVCFGPWPCPIGRCGAPMRWGETCARYAGHTTRGRGKGHRTRHALDYKARSQREKRRGVAA
jgi:hypothetical protein